jgi:hypothetical protein
MLPNTCNLKTAFGNSYGDLHGLSPIEVSIVDVLSRTTGGDIDDQIRKLKSELQALERVKTIPTTQFNHLQELAELLKRAREPFSMFSANLVAARTALVRTIGEHGIAALVARMASIDQWIQLQEEYAEKHDFKIDNMIFGQYSSAQLNFAASLILRDDFGLFETEATFSAADVPLISQTVINKYKLARRSIGMFCSFDMPLEAIYLSYAANDAHNHSDNPYYCFRQDLSYVTELFCSFSSIQYLMCRKLNAVREDSRFTTEETHTVCTFKILAKAMYALGLPTTSALRICYSAMALWDFVESPHQFVCFQSTFNWELVWPLYWVGLTVAQASAMSEEQRAALVANIPEKAAQLWVKRALDNAINAR